MNVQISNQELAQIGITPREFLIEMAVHLYDIGKITMGQARKFAGLDQIAFQKEMAIREVYMKYTMDDLKVMEELKNL